MTEKPDILFNEKELLFMYNADIFPLKHAINKKIYLLFEQLKITLKDTPIHLQFSFPENTDSVTGKISKGENYNLQPYVVLDFPKLLTPKNMFVFRSMFWYGHYFSLSFLVSGNSCMHYTPRFISRVDLLYGHNLYFSIHEDMWHHDLTNSHQIPLDTLPEHDIRMHVAQHGYIKLTYRVDETDAQKIIEAIKKVYVIILNCLSA